MKGEVGGLQAVSVTCCVVAGCKAGLYLDPKSI